LGRKLRYAKQLVYTHFEDVGPNKWTSLKRARRESNPRQPDFFQ
jgi:hypothetical protein